MNEMTDDGDFSYPLDMGLLINGPVALYFNPQILEEAKKWFLYHNYEVVTFDCTTWQSEDDFHSSVSQELGFPDYYGRNLDAFNDCLSEIGDSQKQGTVLILLRFDKFAQSFHQFCWHVLDIIATCSYRFLLGSSYKLIALVQSDDPTLYFQAVGAHPVAWNPREWLNKNRGL